VAFTVDVTRVGTSDGTTDLGMCQPGGNPRLVPQFSCQAEGPGRWLVSEPGTTTDEALADQRGRIAVAQVVGTQTVPGAVLLLAVTSLQPASAGQIAALS